MLEEKHGRHKKEPFKLLVMKTITLNGIKNTLKLKKVKISDPENIAIEIIQNKTQREKIDQEKKNMASMSP